MKWITIEEQLPEDGQLVIIHIPYNKVFGKRGRINIDVAIFNQGKIPREGEPICHADQWGNNKTPYCFDNGPTHYFGQNVTHWMPVPGSPLRAI